MHLEIEMAIELLDQIASEDLEACQTAVRAGNKEAALDGLGQAISKLGAVLDTLRDIPREAQNLGLHVGGL
jgi:hypothetical protein